jgi:hypothetical protein
MNRELRVTLLAGLFSLCLHGRVPRSPAAAALCPQFIQGDACLLDQLTASQVLRARRLRIKTVPCIGPSDSFNSCPRPRSSA